MLFKKDSFIALSGYGICVLEKLIIRPQKTNVKGQFIMSDCFNYCSDSLKVCAHMNALKRGKFSILKYVNIADLEVYF